MNYIRGRAEHHKQRSYEAEFEAMLQKSGIVFEAKGVRVNAVRAGLAGWIASKPGTPVPGFRILRLRHW